MTKCRRLSVPCYGEVGYESHISINMRTRQEIDAAIANVVREYFVPTSPTTWNEVRDVVDLLVTEPIKLPILLQDYKERILNTPDKARRQAWLNGTWETTED